MGSDSDLRFPKDNRIPARILLIFGFLLPVLVTTSALLLFLLIQEVTSNPGIRAAYIAFLGVGLFMSLGIAYLLAQFRSFSVRSGVMMLAFPIRTKTGRRIRQVRLGAILNAEPHSDPQGYKGLGLTLSDGSHFVIYETDLGQGGSEFLDRLLDSVAGRRESNRGPD